MSDVLANALLCQALQDQLQALQSQLLQQTNGEGGVHAIHAVLARLQALAQWQDRVLQQRSVALVTALRSIVAAAPQQRRQLLPHGLRLVYCALGPAWRQAVLRAVLSGPGSVQAERLRRFLAGLPVPDSEAAALQAAREALQVHVQAGLRALADTCAHSPVNLDACLAEGIAQRLRHLRHLACFLGEEASHCLARLEGLVLLLYWQPGPPVAARLLQQLLWRLALGRSAAQLMDALWQALHDSSRPAAAQAVSTEQELVHGFSVLRQWLEQPSRAAPLHVEEATLFECCRLGWVLEALGCPLQSCLLQVLQQLCTALWYRQEPLPPELHRGLRRMIADPGMQAGARPAEWEDPAWLGHWLGLLLLNWPDAAGGEGGVGQAEMRLRNPDGTLLPPCRLHEVPARLAEELRVVPDVEAHWFQSPAHWQAFAPDLERDLFLLEQGAAALRLGPLERYCAVLQEVLQLLPYCPEARFPVALLQAARDCLLHMLDRAAQWLAPLPDAGHLAALQAWTAEAVATPEGKRNAAPDLQRSLAQALNPAARALERSVRLTLSAPPQVAEAEGQHALLAPLLVLLRWLLACSEADTRERREAGLPQALVVAVRCPWPAQLQLVEAWSRQLPDEARLRRLRRKAGVLSLSCRLLPQGGRCFELQLG